MQGLVDKKGLQVCPLRKTYPARPEQALYCGLGGWGKLKNGSEFQNYVALKNAVYNESINKKIRSICWKNP